MSAEVRATNIRGLSVEVRPEFLRVSSSTWLRVVSTAPYGAGFKRVRTFLSLPAPERLDAGNPGSYLMDGAARLGVAGPFVGFLTAVHLNHAVVVAEREGDLAVTVVATVGVANSSRPGEMHVAMRREGTINLVVVVDGDLSVNALHEMLAMTAESKALTVYEGGVLAPSGLPATGTSSDAYAVACTGRGEHHQYAGSVTVAGYLVGKAVRRAVGEGLVSAKLRLPPANPAHGV